MKKLTVIAVATLVIAGVARAGTFPGHSVSVHLIASSTPHIATTARVPLPALAPALKSVVTFNGHIPTSCWADSRYQFECGWHGALMIVSGTKGPGPNTIRTISLRHDRVVIFARFSW